jgi:hypothetical protein
MKKNDVRLPILTIAPFFWEADAVGVERDAVEYGSNSPSGLKIVR